MKVINHHRDHNAPCLYSTKYYITIVSNFSWVLQSSQEKLKNWGGKQSLWTGENGQCTVRRTRRLSQRKYFRQVKIENRLSG